MNHRTHMFSGYCCAWLSLCPRGAGLLLPALFHTVWVLVQRIRTWPCQTPFRLVADKVEWGCWFSETQKIGRQIMVKSEQVRKCFFLIPHSVPLFWKSLFWSWFVDDILPKVGGNLAHDQTRGFYTAFTLRESKCEDLLSSLLRINWLV